MSFIRKLFGGSGEEASYHTNFKEGDIFYWKKQDKYHVYKLLVIDEKHETFHVTVFEEEEALPTLESIGNLKVRVLHTPISSSGFKNVVLITNVGVSTEDLLGYFTYIKHTNNIDEIVKYAKRFYKEGWQYDEQQDLRNAIRKYSLAIDLLPNFVEALDN